MLLYTWPATIMRTINRLTLARYKIGPSTGSSINCVILANSGRWPPATVGRGPRHVGAMRASRAIDPELLKSLSDMLGIPPVVLKYWKLDPSIGGGTVFLTSLLQDEGLAVGAYDGRVTAEDTGIAGSVDPNSGGNDPTMTAIGGVYTATWNVYLASSNIEATAARASQGDAKIVAGPLDVPGSGRTLAGVDPTGAAFGVWQKANCSGRKSART